jgi:hypothetical protein
MIAKDHQPHHNILSQALGTYHQSGDKMDTNMHMWVSAY